MKRSFLIRRDIAVTVMSLIAAIGVCEIFSWIDQKSQTGYCMVFVLAVAIISRLTDGYFYGLAASFCGVVIANYLFTYPYMAFNWTEAGYPLAFLAMLIVSLIISTLNTYVKEKEKGWREAEKERIRADLLRSISHDIRTPLTTIVGASSILLEQKLEEEETEELLQDIREDAQGLIRMVENILSVTRFQTGAAIKKSDEIAEDILGSAIAQIKRNYPGVKLHVQAPNEILMVPMDAVLIEKVLINFMENAVIHGKTEHIWLSLEKDRSQAVFRVRDQGCGIEKDKLERIFSGGFRDAATHPVDVKRNLGIGLSVCKSIIQAHGGTIQAKNNPEGGATFQFALPVEEDTTWKSGIEF